jgi:hypothetical protein
LSLSFWRLVQNAALDGPVFWIRAQGFNWHVCISRTFVHSVCFGLWLFWGFVFYGFRYNWLLDFYFLWMLWGLCLVLFNASTRFRQRNFNLHDRVRLGGSIYVFRRSKNTLQITDQHLEGCCYH